MKDNAMLSKLFFKLLPVQVLIVAMSAINSIVDGAVAGRCIGASAVGVVGLYYSIVNVLSAFGAVLLGGTSVLCGKAMGMGDLERTNRIFTVNLAATTAIGALMMFISFTFSGPIADLLGASPELKSQLVTYIRGYAIGIMPLLLAQQVAAFLQMERQSIRGYAGIAGMILCNVILDLLLVAVLRMGIWGLALATAMSNWVYLIILIPYYISGRSQLQMDREHIEFTILAPIFVVGVPGAVLVFVLAVRSVVINRILLTYAGSDGLSAQSAFNMLSGLFIAIALGTGSVVRMLTSVFVGEEDRDSIKRLMRIALTRALPMSLIVTAVIALLSTPISAIFFPDRSSEVFRLTRQILLIYSFCVPMIVLCQIIANYLQATGHNVYMNVLSVFDGFFAMVIPAAMLAPRIGALGVWIANPIGIVLTLLMSLCFVCIWNRHIPVNADEWLLFKPEFGVPDEDRLDIGIHSINDVTNTATKVQEFCEAHGLDTRTSYYSALCLEEMAGNVVDHGFNKDNKSHMVEAHVTYKQDEVMLRIKDDCVPFDPMERASLFTGDDPLKNIGIRMVMHLADDVSYQSLLGLNVLTMNIHKK